MQELQGGDPRRIGPYRLVGRLSAGGMGMVFAGRSAGGRAVAVKVIRAELAGDAEFRVRWTGFTIGYDIVTGYHQRHPDTGWPAITAASAATILAGSHYQPCSS